MRPTRLAYSRKDETMDFHGILGKLRAIESLGIREAEECNMTAEGEMCPVHGMEECDGYQGTIAMEDGPDRDGEYFGDADSLAGSTIGQGGTSGTVPHISEDDDKLRDIVDQNESAVRDFIDSGELPDELFDTLYEYYFAEMPYGVQKARDGDPHNWIADRFSEDLRSLGLGDGIEEEAPLGGIPFAGLGATNNGPDQVGFVVTGGTNVNHFEETSMDLNESININTSISINDGKVSKTLNVSATDDDVEALASVLRLAGIGGGNGGMVVMRAQAQPEVEHKACGCEGPCDCDQTTMENADHDYGHDPKSEAGEPLDVQDYIWDGPHINQRFGKIGDNTLMSERRESIYKALTEEYESFLAEAELAPSDVGSQSPLTATKRDTFDKDPFSGEDAVTDGSHSPLSTVKRQDVMN